MKTSKYQVLKTIALCVVLLAAARTGKAQVFPNSYINVDWQVGVPLGSSLADKASGWGMNFEGGYFITPAIAVGPFISYQTNLETIPRQTLDLGNGSALTVNQKHSVFQLPFGVTSRYTWLTDSVFQPYAGLKLGANYAELSSYYYVVKQYNDTWGFFLSPEIGVSIFRNIIKLSVRASLVSPSNTLRFFSVEPILHIHLSVYVFHLVCKHPICHPSSEICALTH